MTLDFDLVRRILFAVEECPDRNGLRVVAFDDVEEGKLDYHVVYCKQKGLIYGIEHNTNSRWTFYSVNLTPFGHDFVAEARNDTIWGKAKALVKEKGIPTTIDVLKTALGAVIKSMF